VDKYVEKSFQEIVDILVHSFAYDIIGRSSNLNSILENAHHVLKQWRRNAFVEKIVLWSDVATDCIPVINPVVDFCLVENIPAKHLVILEIVQHVQSKAYSNANVSVQKLWYHAPIWYSDAKAFVTCHCLVRSINANKCATVETVVIVC
jgi:hypothetical protein